MSIGNVVAILGAGMGGYLKGRQQKQEEEAAASDQEYRDWQRQQVKDQAARDASLRGDLSAAGAPVTMTQSGGRPETMDDADVGQPGEQAVAPNSFAVNGQQFADQGQAQAAATAANALPAVSQRVAAAYMKNGQAGMAAQVRRDAQQTELAGLQLDAAKQQALNQQYDQHLMDAASKGHQGVANFISNTAGDGQGGGATAQVIPSADGKTVQYAITNPDGSTRVLPYQFSNDQNDAIKAAFMLSKSVSPADKLAHIHQDAELARQVAKDKSESDYQTGMLKNSADKVGMMQTIQELKNAGRVATGGKKSGTAFEKMDEDSKLQYQGLIKTEQAASENINKALAAGTLDPKSDAYSTLMQGVVAARRARIGFEMRQGLTEPSDVAAGITNGEKDPGKIATGIQEAYALGGKDFGDKVKAAAQPVLDQVTAAAAKAAPVSAPAGTMVGMAKAASGRAQIAANIEQKKKIDADPDVIALRQQIESAASGRAAIPLKSQLTALLAQRYGQ